VKKNNQKSLPAYLQESARGSLLKVLLRPRSASERIEGPLGDYLKISVSAPPIKGKANEALLRFLADQMGLKRSQLSIQAGTRSFRKLIALNACPPQQVLDRLKIHSEPNRK
jgi:uncharacterized protein